MTYKNVKFHESPVMRSLERVAVEKGIIKPETIQKTASKKGTNLAPGPNLEENIFKLCSGLREQGFSKQAIEIESKFFNLKKAVHLYDTHGETGDDLINAAHPDGSHQMKDVDGDAMIETILDKHKAMKRMIEKEPTGKQGSVKKLADIVKSAGKINNKDAINAIKIVLGQDAQEPAPNLNSLYAEANNSLERFIKIYKGLLKKLEDLGVQSVISNWDIDFSPLQKVMER